MLAALMRNFNDESQVGEMRVRESAKVFSLAEAERR